MEKNLKVIQDPENEITLEVMAKAITDISEGIKKLRSGRLNEKALLLLIQHSAPTKNGSQRYGLNEIKDILSGIELLKITYLKK